MPEACVDEAVVGDALVSCIQQARGLHPPRAISPSRRLLAYVPKFGRHGVISGTDATHSADSFATAFEESATASESDAVKKDPFVSTRTLITQMITALSVSRTRLNRSYSIYRYECV